MFFDLLEQHSLFLKPAKCEFFQTAMDYLGIRVQRGELMIDPAKIAGITNWPTTLTPSKKSEVPSDFSATTIPGSPTSQKSQSH